MSWGRVFRKPTSLLAGAALLAVGGVVTSARTTSTARSDGTRWVGTWEAAMATAVGDGCADCTIRDVIHTSVGGPALRVRLSNAFGTAPLRVGHTTVALPVAPGSAGVRLGTLRQVTFHKHASVT